MNVSNLIVSSIRHAVAEVFTTMLGDDIEPGEVTVEHAAPEANDDVVSFIGVAGTWTGTGPAIRSQFNTEREDAAPMTAPATV